MKSQLPISFLLIILLGLASQGAWAFYTPSSGRWLSRDPVEEKGGFNLSGFKNNDLANHYDLLGLDAGDVDVSQGKNGRLQFLVHKFAIVIILDRSQQGNPNKFAFDAGATGCSGAEDAGCYSGETNQKFRRQPRFQARQITAMM